MSCYAKAGEEVGGTELGGGQDPHNVHAKGPNRCAGGAAGTQVAIASCVLAGLGPAFSVLLGATRFVEDRLTAENGRAQGTRNENRIDRGPSGCLPLHATEFEETDMTAVLVKSDTREGVGMTDCESQRFAKTIPARVIGHVAVRLNAGLREGRAEGTSRRPLRLCRETRFAGLAVAFESVEPLRFMALKGDRYFENVEGSLTFTLRGQTGAPEAQLEHRLRLQAVF